MLSSANPRASIVSDVTTDVDILDEPSPWKQRQARGECARSGCTKPAADSDYCDEHNEEMKARRRDSNRKRRAKAKLQKICTRCIKRKRRGRSAYCTTCQIQRARIRKLDVTRDVDKSARVASRMIAWVNSPTNAGRTRLRGGHRGRPPIEEENRLDVEDVQKNVVTAVDAIALADSAETAELPPIQRQDTRQAAGAWWLLIARQALVIARRNGGGLPETVAELLGEVGDSDDGEET
jgi:hypothetical protein